MSSFNKTWLQLMKSVDRVVMHATELLQLISQPGVLFHRCAHPFKMAIICWWDVKPGCNQEITLRSWIIRGCMSTFFVSVNWNNSLQASWRDNALLWLCICVCILQYKTRQCLPINYCCCFYRVGFVFVASWLTGSNIRWPELQFCNL